MGNKALFLDRDGVININHGHVHKIENFDYNVNISSEEYLEMIRNKYISVILDLNEEEIEQGIKFIKKNYPNQLSFKDTLTIEIFN